MARFVFMMAALIVLLAGAQPTVADERPPNLVIILTDDMGYADLRAFGDSEIPTPHLDRLAGEGTRFTNAYTVAPICVSGLRFSSESWILRRSFSNSTSSQLPRTIP